MLCFYASQCMIRLWKPPRCSTQSDAWPENAFSNENTNRNHHFTICDEVDLCHKVAMNHLMGHYIFFWDFCCNFGFFRVLPYLHGNGGKTMASPKFSIFDIWWTSIWHFVVISTLWNYLQKSYRTTGAEKHDFAESHIFSPVLSEGRKHPKKSKITTEQWST